VVDETVVIGVRLPASHQTRPRGTVLMQWADRRRCKLVHVSDVQHPHCARSLPETQLAPVVGRTFRVASMISCVRSAKNTARGKPRKRLSQTARRSRPCASAPSSLWPRTQVGADGAHRACTDDGPWSTVHGPRPMFVPRSLARRDPCREAMQNACTRGFESYQSGSTCGRC
jgi:hypothetical protein